MSFILLDIFGKVVIPRGISGLYLMSMKNFIILNKNGRSAGKKALKCIEKTDQHVEGDLFSRGFSIEN